MSVLSPFYARNVPASSPLRRTLSRGLSASLLGILFLFGPAAAGIAADAPDAAVIQRPTGDVVVPDKFLRRWDPVTIFFDSDLGPSQSAPEHHPEKFVTMSPAHPGAFTWLNARTLQFRPAEPWTPLTHVRWTVGGKTIDLAALMSAPQQTEPQNGAEGLAPVGRISLTLPEPVDVGQLKRVLTIELRPLPGIDADRPRLLDPSEYEIKTEERASRSAPARYTLVLHNPIPGGTKATLRLRLSPEDALDADFYELDFATRTPFRLVSVGCAVAAENGAGDAASSGSEAATAGDTENANGGDQGDDAGHITASPDGDQAAQDESGNAGGTDSAQAAHHHRHRPHYAAAPASPDSSRTAARAHPSDMAPIPAAGVSYTRDDALACGSEDRSLLLRFSARLGSVTPVTARNLVRITPAADDLNFTVSGNVLEVKGKFKTGTAYRIGLDPAPIEDAESRPLIMPQGSQLYVSFAQQEKLFRWNVASGIAERFGPQMLPVSVRGYEKLDLRIHKIDPLDLSFWPLNGDVTTDDQQRPPGPGEEPAKPVTGNEYNVPNITGHIQALGSPSISELVSLPLQNGDVGAKFGIDLAPMLQRISGANAPGTYLVGARALDDTQRHWVRLQVTDLALSTVEEDDRVQFIVTSLKTALPVPGATIQIEDITRDGVRPLAQGLTDSSGIFTWRPSEQRPSSDMPRPNRLIVSNGKDRLIMGYQPEMPELIHAEVSRNALPWLQWTSFSSKGRIEPPELKCHIFPERPIYRPEEPVHIKGYVREYDKGVLTPVTDKATLIVTGPDNLEWRYPVDLGAQGSFHHLFDEKTDVTDNFNIHLEVGKQSCGAADFRKEAYRLPDFEVRLNSADTVPLDAPFPVKLSASYYAGGMVADRPVRWRVTQFPYAPPRPKDGFFYSTDARFAAEQPFDSKAALEQQSKTDAQGTAQIMLDPSAEKTAQPRKYVVEATVTGADDRTVTDTHEVIALPPFTLGVKVPRYLDRAREIQPEIVALGPAGDMLAGQKITVRLKQRQWRSILEASDFSNGIAKYQTDTLDTTLSEQTVTSTVQPLRLSLPVKEAGVYVVELEARDRIGRRQSVSVDLFVSGDTPVTWSRPPAVNFKATADKDSYVPGDTANIILESPFQNAAALVMVEQPDGNDRYFWLPVQNGTATLRLPVLKQYMPGIPVHIALMRGRLGENGAADPGSLDLRKPSTVVANVVLNVKPVKNIVKVDLAYPDKVQPGDDIDLKIKLSDDAGKPMQGEVTLWLIDSAVLSLRKEAPLDPLPDFIVKHPARLSMRDTRDMVLGRFPFEEMPGGDERGTGDILDTTTVRKNFTPLPYYNPSLMVDASGEANVHIHMPDNLTNYKIRAIVASGNDRFGFGTGKIMVRLPVQVQPSLPRFVRSGDSFTLSAFGRTVDGIGGAARAQLRVAGLTIADGTGREFDLNAAKPQRIDFAASVPDPGYGNDGKPLLNKVTVAVGVERDSDKKRDAFSVTLPLLTDRRPVTQRLLGQAGAGQPFELPPPAEPARTGTLKRSLLFSTDPLLARLATGLDYLVEYPFGCTEQRISLARAEIATRRLHDVLTFSTASDRVDQDVKTTLAYLATVIGDNGLASFWPGDTPSVALTAWVAEFLTEAQQAGYSVDPAMRDHVLAALKDALRSDSPFLHPREAYAERVWALMALSEAGETDSDYADELARRADQLDTESVAGIIHALNASGKADSGLMAELKTKLWKGMIFRLDHGKEIYGGLQGNWQESTDILPSEARTLAQAIEATGDPADQPRRNLLIDALLQSTGTDGWGDTNANAEAAIALVSLAQEKPPAGSPAVTVFFGDDRRDFAPDTQNRAQKLVSFYGGAIRIDAHPASSAQSASAMPPLSVMAETQYIPAAPGATVAAAAQGFAVTRTAERVVGDGTEKLSIDKPGAELHLAVGDVVEDGLDVVNPEDRHFVAIVMPLAAGMEPLNPNLATAPPEATPSQELTLKPSYMAYLDDQVAFYYDDLPKGSYHFALRTRATVPGHFTQPAAFAEAMYHEAANGNSNGVAISISRPDSDAHGDQAIPFKP